MKMKTALALAAVLALPFAASAEAPPDGQPAAETTSAAPATAGTTGTAAPESVADTVPEPLFLNEGCYAEQICIHQPPATVSCSGPPNTNCSSSWGGCGRVTCNGVTIRCPGYCVGDHHCANFCMNTYGSFDYFCNTGCCECL